MKRGNEENIETTQAIVAMDNGRQGQVTFGPRRRLTGAQNRDSEVQVLVVFSKNNFSWTCAVDPEDAESARSALRIQCCKMLGRLEAETGHERVSNRHEPADPGRLVREDEPRQHFGIGRRSGRKLDRISVGEIHRRVGFGDRRLRRERHRGCVMVFGRHAGPADETLPFGQTVNQTEASSTSAR